MNEKLKSYKKENDGTWKNEEMKYGNFKSDLFTYINTQSQVCNLCIITVTLYPVLQNSSVSDLLNVSPALTTKRAGGHVKGKRGFITSYQFRCFRYAWVLDVTSGFMGINPLMPSDNKKVAHT